MKLRLFGMILTLLFSAQELSAGVDCIVDLSGTWRFRTGDHITWRNPGYNDERWDTIAVPATWESQGYEHDGYAWYRKTFTIPEEYVGVQLILVAGKINDADQMFLNGRLIGSTGSFPPHPQSERNTIRIYNIPEDLLEDKNVIAIRVYDMGQEGGIHEGPIGIAREADKQELLNLRCGPEGNTVVEYSEVFPYYVRSNIIMNGV